MPRIATPLTDTFVRQAKHSGKRGDDKHSDGGGMFLLIKPTGAKHWHMDYRRPAGKRNTLAFGVYPTVTLAQARKKREDARSLLAQGIDPSEAKKAQDASLEAAGRDTVKAVGDAWLELRKDGWSESHYTREKRNLEKDLYPHLGSRPIAKVLPPELLKVIRKVEERGALDVAHRVLLTARGVWHHAIAEGFTQLDITHVGKALKEHVKKPHPAITTPAELAGLLRASDGYKGGPVVRAALAIAPLLFQRPGNLRAMRWADLDLEAGLWTIPSADMKRRKSQKEKGSAHVVPLPRQAVELLKEMQPLTGYREHVFPGFRDPKKPMSEAAVNAALQSMGYKDVHTWHGYRATGRTILREVFKVDIDVIEAQLAHTGGRSHGGAYDRATFVDERVAVLQQWADYLDKLRTGAEVIPLRA